MRRRVYISESMRCWWSCPLLVPQENAGKPTNASFEVFLTHLQDFFRQHHQ